MKMKKIEADELADVAGGTDSERELIEFLERVEREWRTSRVVPNPLTL
jgi:hypothetical protein